jgi:hypothetical protein
MVKCASCGRGKHILQANPQEVFDYRARVALVTEGKENHSDIVTTNPPPILGIE